MKDNSKIFREEQIQNKVFDEEARALRTKFSPLDESLVRQLGQITTSLESLKKIVANQNSHESILRDGRGSDRKTYVNEYNALKVNDQGIPDLDDKTLAVPVSGYLTDVNGNIDARVNASLANPIDFSVRADVETDIYISAISFKIADQNAILSDFGALTDGIDNGMQLIYENSDLGESILADNLRSNFDIIRLCLGTPAVSSGVEAFRATNVVANSEGYIPSLSFAQVFNTKFGVRLRAGTFDKLTMRVRDRTDQIDAFDVFYYGLKVFR